MKAALAEKSFPMDRNDPLSRLFEPILVAPCDNNGAHFRCVDGKPILYVYPALMDLDHQYQHEIFTTCMLMFCYKIYQGEPFTVLVDVRAGHGWPNVSVTKMYRWIRACCADMSRLFPGGLHKCIVFTIPIVAKALWHVVRPLLASSITDSLILIPGAGTAYSTPLPEKAMVRHISHPVAAPVSPRAS